MQTESSPVKLRVLAIDAEYLIALDVQYILAEYSWCHVDVDTTAHFQSALASADGYDVVIIDPDPINLTRREIAESIAASGATVIWSSLDVPSPGPTSPDDIVTLLKPFSARHVLQAIVDALSPVQPEIARAVAALL